MKYPEEYIVAFGVLLLSLMKQIGITLLLLVACSVQAQSFEEWRKKSQAEFDKYRSDKERDFNEFREKTNAEFADFMRKRWSEHEAKAAEPLPSLPEPPKPVVKEDPEEKPSNTPIKLNAILQPVKPIPTVKPVVPIPQVVPTTPVEPSETTEPTEPAFSFTYYGTPCAVSLTSDMRFRLADASENSVANAWEKLSSPKYLQVVAECLRLRDSLVLSDWAYIRFTDIMASSFLKPSNEAKILQMYVLVQSGYKVRIARSGNQLYLLMPSTEKICEKTYCMMDGIAYYFLDKNAPVQSFSIFTQAFPGEQTFTLRQNEVPRLQQSPSEQRNLLSANRYPGTMVLLKTNKNLINYYAEYPLSDKWNTYAAAGLSEESKQQLYAVLRRSIFQKTYTEAADILLNFVQSAFKYQTDGEQFGRERPLFADETLYYPYCDCEDRAILYANLVHDLLNLDVVMVHFPGTATTAGHVATAVHFRQEVQGDHMMVNGKKYVICDPTYIGAKIGDAMPQYRNASADIQTITW